MTAALNADLRFLFDTLYSNRKISVIDGYFSISDIEELTATHSFQTTIPVLMSIGSSRGIFLRFLVLSLSTPSDLVYIYKANPNILRANPTNIKLFTGTCPPIPTCLLCIPGTHNIYQSNGMLAESNRQRAGVATSTQFTIGADPPVDMNLLCQSSDGSTTCSCLKKTIVDISEPLSSPCDPAGNCPTMPVASPYTSDYCAIDDSSSRHCC